MEPDPRWRSPGPNTWYSPKYRGNGGNRGGGFRGNHNYSPRQNNSSWQPSSYNYQHQNAYKNFSNSPYTSTPIRHQNFRSRSPHSPQYFRGGGRQHHRNSFGQSPHNTNRNFGQQNQDNIENWVSPQMWQDPWEHLLPDSVSKTKFAETDFSVSGSESQQLANADGEGEGSLENLNHSVQAKLSTHCAYSQPDNDHNSTTDTNTEIVNTENINDSSTSEVHSADISSKNSEEIQETL